MRHAQYIQRFSRRARRPGNAVSEQVALDPRANFRKVSGVLPAPQLAQTAGRPRGAADARSAQIQFVAHTHSKRVTTNRLCRSCTFCGARAGCHAVGQPMRSQVRCERLEARLVATPMRRRGAAPGAQGRPSPMPRLTIAPWATRGSDDDNFPTSIPPTPTEASGGRLPQGRLTLGGLGKRPRPIDYMGVGAPRVDGPP
eukprot:366158-Pyramimonas_sp.AAC.1